MTTYSDHARLLPFPVETEGGAFQKQESTLILLNLMILSSLLVVELVFEADLGPASKLVIALFGARFLMQTGELLWLHGRREPLGAQVVRWYGTISIANHLLFAAAASIAAEGEDTHYSVLMILPVVAAAFRLPLWGTLLTAGVAGFLNILEVWVYFQQHPPGSRAEYFEATALGLLYLVVGLVVWLLVTQLRREQARLREIYEELECTRDRLVQEEKLSAIGRLSSAIAHEIRNPIGMISSSLAMGIRESTDPQARKELFDVAATEAKRLEAFTSDFLAYARGATPKREPVELHSTLSYLLEVSRAHAAEKAVTIEASCPDMLRIEADPFQLHQAMLNLLGNALDAAPSGSTILLGCEDRTGRAVLYVENAGPPIPHDTVATVFEPFVTTKPHGTGLGLAISRKIARAHGGDLVLESNEPDRIRFALWLPHQVGVAAEAVRHG